MTRSTKITLSLVGLTIVLLIAGAAAFAGFTYYKFEVRNEAARTTGVEFGKNTDDHGCVDESIRQFAEYKETSFSIRLEQFQIGHFTAGCLTTGRHTQKFCNAVPRSASYLDRLTWTTEQCRKAGLRDGGPCNEIFKSAIAYCSTRPDVN